MGVNPVQGATMFLGFLGCLFINVLAWYIIGDLELADQQAVDLLELHDSIKMNPMIMERITLEDVSYICSQYDIWRMTVRYDFDYETAKTLYQYHQYHNISVGSTNVLVESFVLQPPTPQDDDALPLELLKPTPTPAEVQSGKILALLLISYWLVIVINHISRISPK